MIQFSDGCSILERVERHAIERPDENAFVYISDRSNPGQALSWSELWARSAFISDSLPVSSVKQPLGVLLFCRNDLHFIIGLLAIWMRGGFAIPGTGSLNRKILERNIHILDASRPNIILHDLTDFELEKLRPNAGGAVFQRIEPLSSDKARSSHALCQRGGGVVQFSSGTTSAPKAIVLTEQMIVENCKAIASSYNLSPESVGVNWLPLHHDMGLVGSVISALWSGALSVLLKPTLFIQNPLSWLSTINNWRATSISAPNFAYASLVHAAQSGLPDDIDLSCLKTAVIGGEPVRRATVEGLIETFETVGLSPDALAPCYGLAEATLLVSSGQRRGGPVFDNDDTALLGSPIDALKVEVWRDGLQCADGEEGEVVLSGRSVGHIVPIGKDWRSFANQHTAPPVFSGDFGFVKDGELCVTGRKANKIILRGRNIFAEDVEGIAQAAVPEMVPGGVAAFGIAQDSTEGLCILIEVRKSQEFNHLSELNSQVGSRLGVKLSRIVILRNASLPRTSSGKVIRAAARDLLIKGALKERTREDVIQTNHR
ncbi:fatty acyl-AMP ligase [Amylibacter sp. SFDW26]|uniref:AMP-binding protein n=1 Tax=Amylibacter sp. SFDW26 TaxID=2652722 RepID=UPI00126286EA|nr:AMP-binding protein [Amylibacter sp. SFDW26]KAB7615945.1 fatty acyl-AMP ligase [Amylibacter sp. SFDW26]